jgi:adenine deaminase
LLVALAVAVSCGSARGIFPAQGSLSADDVLINGKIITVNPQDTIAEALAIRDGRILSVGSNESINKLVGSKTRIIDLKGLTATPGLSTLTATLFQEAWECSSCRI